MRELWKAVVGWEALYQVSNLGRVRRTAKRTRRSHAFVLGEVNQYGYRRITLRDGPRRERFWAHRLVLEAFRGPAPTVGHRVNHKDGDKLNNWLGNLEWVTIAENNKHSRVVLGNDFRGDSHHRSTISDATAKRIYRDVASAKWSLGDVARRYGVNKSLVWTIASGEGRKHLGLAPISGHRKRKLSINDIPKIRAAMASGESQTSIAKRYGVSTVAICNIHTRRRWASVP